MMRGSGESNSRLAEAAGAEPTKQMRDEKLHAVKVQPLFLKEKVSKHVGFGGHLDMRIGEKCMPLRCGEHFKKNIKMVRGTFGS